MKLEDIKHLVFGVGHRADMSAVIDGHLVYELFDGGGKKLLTFSVPPHDQLGATFKIYDTPKVLMRWVRKEVERQIEEQKTIEQAKADWEREQG